MKKLPLIGLILGGVAAALTVFRKKSQPADANPAGEQPANTNPDQG